MRGITPVIAIILLLLMAVAAAGGFYFVYQGFTEEGEESGSTQIESLGEQSLAQIQIESAAGGRIYVRNVGASDIDLSKSTVYVENQPVSVNRSVDILEEKNRAILKLIELPSCTTERCEVKISGTASASKKIDLSRLVCSSDADCYSSETCEGGICVEEEVVPAECGDGECSGDEDGESCFEDCGPRKIAIHGLDPSEMEPDIYSFDWNGSAYVRGENVTANSYSDVLYRSKYDSQGNILGVGHTGADENQEVSWYYYDGSWTTDNVTTNVWEDNSGLSGCDFNSSDEAMAVWLTGDARENLAWASFDGSTWTTPINLTSNDASVRMDGPNTDFTFASDDRGVAVWAPSENSWNWVNYSIWDDGWGQGGHLVELSDQFSHGLGITAARSNSTHVMVAWLLEQEYLSGSYKDVIQWVSWDGSTWSDFQNVTDDLGNMWVFDMQADKDGSWYLAVSNTSSTPSWIEWYSWQNGWVYEGNLTDEPGYAAALLERNENGALTATLMEEGTSAINELLYWDGTDWQGPIGIYS